MNQIKENAINKRKTIKSYREEQDRITAMRNKLFEEKLHERRQSELDKIKQYKKNEKNSFFSFGNANRADANANANANANADDNNNSLFQRIKNKFITPQKSVRKRKLKHSKRSNSKRSNQSKRSFTKKNKTN
jgi:hypothetical protein